MGGGTWRAAIAGVALLGSACGDADTSMELRIGMSDFSFAPGVDNLTAGTYTFVATNNGTVPHAVAIEGDGIETRRTGDVAPGQTGRFTITLEPGTYTLFCPVGDHRQRGMTERLEVQAAGGGGY